MQVQENSPGHRAGLEPFFDFIVSINNTRLVGLLHMVHGHPSSLQWTDYSSNLISVFKLQACEKPIKEPAWFALYELGLVL